MEEQSSASSAIEESINSRYSYWVREALDELPYSFTITDPCLPGHPIVFASREFLKMCGYSSNEDVIGKHQMIMFQQAGINNRRSLLDIRHAITQETTIQLTLLNHHKNNLTPPFWTLFHMFPVFSKDDGRLIHFVGVQVPIMPKPTLAELDRISSFDSVLADDTELGDSLCKASDLEKQRARTAMSTILSMLTHYSQLTGRLVSDKRCCASYMSRVGASLYISLGRIKQSFVLTDPHKTCVPIVYASDAFLELTGYARHEVLGQNSRFLSGQETDVSAELQIRKSIESGQGCTMCILNYRKDGSTFWNSLHMSPVRNASGKIAYFVEVQMNVKHENPNLRPEIRHLSVVGAVKVAVRSSGMIATCSNS
ncbi:putative LOV domain-containing protein [Tanacetum coccineum]